MTLYVFSRKKMYLKPFLNFQRIILVKKADPTQTRKISSILFCDERSKRNKGSFINDNKKFFWLFLALSCPISVNFWLYIHVLNIWLLSREGYLWFIIFSDISAELKCLPIIWLTLRQIAPLGYSNPTGNYIILHSLSIGVRRVLALSSWGFIILPRSPSKSI